MSYGIQPFAVSLEEIENALANPVEPAGLIGRLFGRRGDLVSDMKRKDGYLLQDDELDEDGELATEEALRELISGAELDESYGDKYAWALKALCWHFGEFLDNSEWSAMRSEWSVRVDHAIEQAGVPEESFGIQRHLIYRGAPISIPAPDDFPFIGYLRRSEIPEVANTLAACDVGAAGGDVQRAIEQIQEWLVRVNQLNGDLVCFYH